MEFKGNIKSIEQDYKSGKFKVAFEIAEAEIPAINELNKLMQEDLSIKVLKFRKRRSLDANGLLWVCLGQIAEVLRTDKWSVYLKMLKEYGQFTYICVKPNAVEEVKAQWRECEVVGEVDINGKKAIQLLCYFGSSTYNTKEFSALLDGVISEMRELGLQPPTSEEMRHSLEQWEKLNQQ